MNGLRIRVPGEEINYVFGLLAGEGRLAADIDFMPVGGGEFIVTPEAWAGLPADTRTEIAEWALPGSEIAAVTPETVGDAGVRSSSDPATGPQPRSSRAKKQTSKRGA